MGCAERGLLRVVADRAKTRRRVVEAQPYRDAEDVSYPSKQNRFESYQWITNRFIEQLNRGLASLRSPFELRIARAQALLSATAEIVRGIGRRLSIRIEQWQRIELAEVVNIARLETPP